MVNTAKITYTSTVRRLVLPGSNVNQAQAWYGIQIDEANSSPDLTRIASDMTLHASLPIHNNIKACLLLDNGTVNYYLKADDWTKKADGTASKLDGTDGQVMMEWPDFYYKVENNFPAAGQHQIKISPYSGAGWTLVPKHYISAFEAGIQRSTNKLASVVNTSADYRGGDNTSEWDASANSLLGKPATNINRTNFRTYARNRGTGWNINSYTHHKWLLWFFAIEFATLNSQKAVNTALTVDGYKQGGLGEGVTTVKGWSTFNSYNPFVNCGASNSLASGSGEVNITITDFGGSGVNVDVKVPRFRGHENPFGHVWKILDGINLKMQSVASGGLTETWISDDPATWNDANYTGYTNVGNQARDCGYIKTALMGSGAEFVPAVTSGADQTHYYCDYYYTTIPAAGVSLKTLISGGRASNEVDAGLTYSRTDREPSYASTALGSRLAFIPA